MNSNTLINSIRENKYDKQLTRLYRYLPAVEKFVKANGGTQQDARDLFQEALIIFCRKAKAPDFQLTSTVDTYLYSICKYMWKDELKKRNKQVLSDNNQHWQELPETSDWVTAESKFQLAEKAIAQLGKRCIELLESFYVKAMNMRQIASKMGFSSDRVAKNQKYKCLEKAREFYREGDALSNH